LLPFFPSPYPDELFFSVCSRFHVRSCNDKTETTCLQLLGCKTSRLYDFPRGLHVLGKRLPEETLNTVQQLVYGTTMFPLYKPFISSTIARMLYDYMVVDQVGCHAPTIHNVLVVNKISLRCCPACFYADLDLYGEAYWHRSHQVYGVRTCHKHREWLRQTHVIGVELSPLTENMLRQAISLQDDKPVHHLHRIAASVHWLLNHNDVMGSNILSTRCRLLRVLKNTCSFLGGIVYRSLEWDIRRFYGEAISEMIFRMERIESFLEDLVTNCHMKHHPLYHILLINFLGLSCGEIITNART